MVFLVKLEADCIGRFKLFQAVQQRQYNSWVKVFKNGQSKICGRQPSTNVTWSILKHLDPIHGHVL